MRIARVRTKSGRWRPYRQASPLTGPAIHIACLGVHDGRLDPRYAELDLALLRAMDGCLLAVGVTALALTNGPVRRGEGWARVAVAVLVGVAQGNDPYRMYPLDARWHGRLGFAALADPPTRPPADGAMG